jgi:CheY-like chemotaxis protein
MHRKILHILLVEDHADTAAVVSQLLQRSGYIVEVAKGAEAARAAAEAVHFDLLICDLSLRDGDGCDLLKELRGLYPMRAIAMTGHGTPEDYRRTAEAGFAAHLLKPVQLSKLLAAIAEGEAGVPMQDYPLVTTGGAADLSGTAPAL